MGSKVLSATRRRLKRGLTVSFIKSTSAVPADGTTPEGSWGGAGPFISQWYRSDVELLAVLHGVGRTDVNSRMLRELKRRLRTGAEETSTVTGKRHNRLGALARLLDDVSSVLGVTAGERLTLFHLADLAPVATPRRHIGEVGADIQQFVENHRPVGIEFFRFAEAARRDGLRAKETYAYQLAIHSLDLALAIYERFGMDLPETSERSRAYALYDRASCLGALGQFRDAADSLSRAAALHRQWNSIRDEVQMRVIAAEQYRWRAAALLNEATSLGQVSDTARQEAKDIESALMQIAAEAGLDAHKPKHLRLSIADPLYSSPSHFASVIACAFGDLARLWNMCDARQTAWPLAQRSRRILLLCWQAGVAANGAFGRQLAKVADELYILIRDLRHLKTAPPAPQPPEDEGVLAAWSPDEEAEWDKRATAEHTWLGLNRRLRRGPTAIQVTAHHDQFDNAQHLFRFGFSDMVLWSDPELRELTAILNGMLGSRGPLTVRQITEVLRSGLAGTRVLVDESGLAVARSVLILLATLNGATYPELLRLAFLVNKRFPEIDGTIRFCDVAPLLRVEWLWKGERPIPAHVISVAQLCRTGAYSPDTMDRWERDRDAVYRGERPIEWIREIAERHRMPSVVMNVLLYAAQSGYAVRHEFRLGRGTPVFSDEMADLDRVRTRRALWIGAYDWARESGQQAVMHYSELAGTDPTHLTTWLREGATTTHVRLLEALSLVLLDRARAALEPIRAHFWWVRLAAGAYLAPLTSDLPSLPTPFQAVLPRSADIFSLGASALSDLDMCLTIIATALRLSEHGSAPISEDMLRGACLAAVWSAEINTYLASHPRFHSRPLACHLESSLFSDSTVFHQHQETDGSCLRSRAIAHAWRLWNGPSATCTSHTDLMEGVRKATFYDALEQGMWADSFEAQERLVVEDLEEPATSFRWVDRLLLGDEPAAWAERQLTMALIGLATNGPREEIAMRLERAQLGFRRTGRVGQALVAGVLRQQL